jgi:hypothetical protein
MTRWCVVIAGGSGRYWLTWRWVPGFLGILEEADEDEDGDEEDLPVMIESSDTEPPVLHSLTSLDFSHSCHDASNLSIMKAQERFLILVDDDVVDLESHPDGLNIHLPFLKTLDNKAKDAEIFPTPLVLVSAVPPASVSSPPVALYTISSGCRQITRLA